MLMFGSTVLSLLVATFGGASPDTLVAVITYPSSLPLSSNTHTPQSTLPDYFDFNDPDDFTTQEHGDSITTPKHDDLHHLYYQNLDSLSSDQEEMDYVLQIMKRFQVGTACFADPSLNWKNCEVRSRYIQQTLRNLTLRRLIPLAVMSLLTLILITNPAALLPQRLANGHQDAPLIHSLIRVDLADGLDSHFLARMASIYP
jgi:hypothetical protein